MSIYVQANTGTPTGFRPWNYKLSGLGCGQCQRPRGMGFDARARYLNGMGVNLDAGLLKPQADNIAAQFVQMRADVDAVNQQLAAQALAGQPQASVANMNQQQSTDLESTIASFTTAYRAFYGNTPPGLSGPALIVGGVLTAAALAVLAEWIAAWWSQQNQIHQLQQTQVNQQISLQNQAAAAYASGDTTTGDQLTQLSQQIVATPPASLTGWLQSNWMYLAAAGVGIFVLNRVL
jgi:hypothetical protein